MTDMLLDALAGSGGLILAAVLFWLVDKALEALRALSDHNRD